LFPTKVIRPVVPNATDLTPVPLLLNVAADSVRLFRFRAPAVSVNVLVEPSVKLFKKLSVPPTLLQVIGKSMVR
jgi:hypothetical protein